MAVVASGEVLARVLGQLHALGAGCIALEDPYRAAADIARRQDRYDAIVLALPCLYTEELPVIATMRKFAPNARIILAAADQHVSMLAAAMRLGATALLTAHGVEVLTGLDAGFGVHAAIAPAAAETRAAQPLAVAPIHAQAGEESAEEASEEPAEEPNVESLDEVHPAHPLLTAEELHALLHDDGDLR